MPDAATAQRAILDADIGKNRRNRLAGVLDSLQAKLNDAEVAEAAFPTREIPSSTAARHRCNIPLFNTPGGIRKTITGSFRPSGKTTNKDRVECDIAHDPKRVGALAAGR